MSTGGPAWTDVVVAIFAILGFLLGLYNLVERHLDRRPRVIVEVTPAHAQITEDNPPKALLLDDRPGNPRPDHLVLLAANVGRLPITIGGYLLNLADGRPVQPPNAMLAYEFPHELLHGQNCVVLVPIRAYARWLAEQGIVGKVGLVCTFKDGIGRRFRNKPFEFDVDAWASDATSA